MADEYDDDVPATPPSAWQLLRSKQKQQPNFNVPNFGTNGELVSEYHPPRFDEVRSTRPPIVPTTPTFTVSDSGGGVNDSIADLKSWMDKIQKDANATAEGKYREHSKINTTSLLTATLPPSIQNRSPSPLASPTRGRRKPSTSDRNEAKLLLRTWHKVDEDTNRVLKNQSDVTSKSKTRVHKTETTKPSLKFDRPNHSNNPIHDHRSHSSQYGNNGDIYDDLFYQDSIKSSQFNDLSLSINPKFNKDGRGDSFDGLFDETEEERERIQRLLPSPSSSSSSSSKIHSHSNHHGHQSTHQHHTNTTHHRPSSRLASYVEYPRQRQQQKSIEEEEEEAVGRGTRVERENNDEKDSKVADYEKHVMKIREKEQAAMFDISCDIFIRRMKRKRLGRCFVGWVNYFKSAVYNFTMKSKKAYQFFERNLIVKVFSSLKQRHYKLIDFKYRILKKKIRRKFLKLWIVWKSETELYNMKIIQFQKQKQWKFLCLVFVRWYDHTMFLVNERKKAYAKIKEIDLMKKEKAAVKWFILRLYSKVFLEWCLHVEEIKKEKKALLKHEQEKVRIAQFVKRIAVIDNSSSTTIDHRASGGGDSASCRAAAGGGNHSYGEAASKRVISIDGNRSESRYDYKLSQNKQNKSEPPVNKQTWDSQRADSKESNTLIGPGHHQQATEEQLEGEEEGILEAMLIGSEPRNDRARDNGGDKTYDTKQTVIVHNDSHTSNAVRNTRNGNTSVGGDVLSAMERRAEERRKAREKLREKPQEGVVINHDSSFSSPDRSSLSYIKKNRPISSTTNRSQASRSVGVGRSQGASRSVGVGRSQGASRSQESIGVSNQYKATSYNRNNDKKVEEEQVALELSQLHYARSLLMYQGFKPWLKLMAILKLSTIKADNFYEDKILSKYWKLWELSLDISKKQHLRAKGEAILWTWNYLDRRRIGRYFQQWISTIHDLNAMAIAVENLHKYKLMKSTLSCWQQSYEVERNHFYQKYHNVKELSKRLKKKEVIRSWYELLLRQKMDNEVTRRREQRWKQVRGWLHTENNSDI